MNRRNELRIRRRFSCEIDAGHRKQLGAILNVSRHGLFVQTRLRLPRTVLFPLHINLRLPARAEPIVLSAQVARQYRVPAALVAAAGGGLGLRIQSAPDAWSALVESFATNDLPTPLDTPSAPDPKASAPRCLLCGRPPAPSDNLCIRCGAQRQSA